MSRVGPVLDWWRRRRREAVEPGDDVVFHASRRPWRSTTSACRLRCQRSSGALETAGPRPPSSTAPSLRSVLPVPILRVVGLGLSAVTASRTARFVLDHRPEGAGGRREPRSRRSPKRRYVHEHRARLRSCSNASGGIRAAAHSAATAQGSDRLDDADHDRQRGDDVEGHDRSRSSGRPGAPREVASAVRRRESRKTGTTREPEKAGPGLTTSRVRGSADAST